MKRTIYLFLFFISLTTSNTFAQSNKELANTKAHLAVRLMDDGKIEESITILKECMKLDPKNYDYEYEYIYAHYLKQDYESVIKLGKKLSKKKNANYEIFALIGNAYDEFDNPKEAIKYYDKGIKKFPDVGLLYLEKGILFEKRGEYGTAAYYYSSGIIAEPSYASNYYRISGLYLESDNKVPGLIYGELFMNIERGSERTVRMSETLYNTFSEGVTFENDSTRSFNLCKNNFNLADFKKYETFPLCLIFSLRFAPTLSNINEINLANLSEVREKYIPLYIENDFKSYPIILFEYHQKMIDAGVFNAYNHYIFQIGAEEEFQQWLEENKEEYDEFLEWYTQPENILTPTKEKYFIFNY